MTSRRQDVGARLGSRPAHGPPRGVAHGSPHRRASITRQHSLRVAFITGAQEAGVPLEDMQNAAGHMLTLARHAATTGGHSLDRHARRTAVTAWLNGQAMTHSYLRPKVSVGQSARGQLNRIGAIR